MVLRRTDRILVLERIDPKGKDIGLVDPKVLGGQNNLHAVMDTTTLMWSLKYDHGLVPPAWKKSKYTSFKALREYLDDYFRNKNIKIVEVID